MPWDAQSFVRDFGIPFEPDPGGRWLNIFCPWCGNVSDSTGEIRYYGGINLQGAYYHCWRCGGHHMDAMIRKVLRVDGDKASQIVAQYRRAGLSAAGSGLRRTGGAKSVTPPGGPLKRPHREYLRERGFDPLQLVEKYGLTGTGPDEYWEDSYFGNRIIIPIYDISGRVVSFQGRDITGESKMRYKGAPLEKVVAHHKASLYGIHKAAGRSRVCLVEGVFDQWRLGDGFVASFGTATTQSQLRELARFNEVMILFDSEKDAQEKARKIARQLAALGRAAEVVELDLGDGRDPGDLTPEEAAKVRLELGFF